MIKLRARKVCNNIGLFLLIMFLVWLTYFLYFSEVFYLFVVQLKNFGLLYYLFFLIFFLVGLTCFSGLFWNIINHIFFEEETELDRKIKKMRKENRRSRRKDMEESGNKIKKERLLYKLKKLGEEE